MAEFQLKERAFKFSVSLIKYFSSVTLNSDFRFLKNQLYRSATSIGANVIEGSGGSSKKELARYFRIAIRSANETTYWLKLILEVFEEVERSKIQELVIESESITRILGKSIATLNSKTNS